MAEAFYRLHVRATHGKHVPLSEITWYRSWSRDRPGEGMSGNTKSLGIFWKTDEQKRGTLPEENLFECTFGEQVFSKHSEPKYFKRKTKMNEVTMKSANNISCSVLGTGQYGGKKRPRNTSLRTRSWGTSLFKNYSRKIKCAFKSNINWYKTGPLSFYIEFFYKAKLWIRPPLRTYLSKLSISNKLIEKIVLCGIM